MDDNSEYRLPFLTGQVPGVGGRIKVHWRDFQVEEIPSYEFSDQGTHLCLEIEKRGRATLDAIVQIARALKISPHQIGYAGLKDTWAITRQWISIEHMDPERIKNLKIPRIRILQIRSHDNKLHIGHLSGNRFIVRIREWEIPPDEAVKRARSIMDLLLRHGVANHFGPQRFGHRKDTHHLGRAMVHNDRERFLDLFLGRPVEQDKKRVSEARTFYDQGDYEQAYRTWPPHFHDHRRTLRALIMGKSRQEAQAAVGKHLRRLYVSAFQSDLFNRVVATRMPDIDKLLPGDLAYKHDNGAYFSVEDVRREQPRCDRFEISPTGPLFGYRMAETTGPAGDIEKAVLNEARLELADFRRSESYRVKGGRRPLRFLPREVDVDHGQDENGFFLELRFELDPGCYATAILREITKHDLF